MTPAGDAAETAVRAALAGQIATRALADAALEPVRGGLSNHAWKAEKDGRSWFVRLGGPESGTLGVDRASEHVLLGVVAAAGLAPGVLACDPSNGLLVSQFIHGAAWRREDACQARNIERIAERLRLLHGLEAPAAVRTVDFAAQARGLEAQLRALPEPQGPGSAAGGGAAGAQGTAFGTGAIAAAHRPSASIRRVADAAFELLAARRPRRVLCHNDLHHLNVLDDGRRLWLVDWEYGGRGDPLFDLASYACQHEFGPAERARLLDACRAGGAMAALDAACTAFDYVQWLWYRLWAARNPDSGGEYLSRAGVIADRLAAAGS